jgi:hypothetical protein
MPRVGTIQRNYLGRSLAHDAGLPGCGLAAFGKFFADAVLAAIAVLACLTPGSDLTSIVLLTPDADSLNGWASSSEDGSDRNEAFRRLGLYRRGRA